MTIIIDDDRCFRITQFQASFLSFIEVVILSKML